MATLQDELDLEKTIKVEARNRVKQILNNALADEDVMHTRLGKRVNEYGFDTYVAHVKAFIEKEVRPKCGVQARYHDVVLSLSELYDMPDLITLCTLITTTTVINAVMTKKNALSDIANLMAIRFEHEAHYQYFLNREDVAKAKKTAITREIGKRVSEHNKSYYAIRCMEHTNDTWVPLDKGGLVALSGRLIENLIRSTGLFDTYDTTGRHGSKMTSVIPTQRLIDIWNVNESNMLDNAFQSTPMIIEPEKWTSYTEGGYYGELRKYYKLLRLHGMNTFFFDSYLERLNETDISPVLRAVNAIQSTPWVINKDVLKVAQKIIENGEELAGVPRGKTLPEIPELTGNYTPEELKAHKKKMEMRIKDEQRRVSKFLRALRTVKTAERFKDYHAIWFPCNMDFRGRVYPIPTFSFQGDDLTRGLILMQDVPAAKDKMAEFWFNVAGCEFTGNDKISFDEMQAWVAEHKMTILEISKDPFGNAMKFWTDCDCPFQFLSWCFEYKKLQDYKEAHNDSCIGWKCGVPVAFDGTCSGLQHFSAALRDEIGGKAVNLIPGDRPRDIYQVVADKVNEILKQDAMNGTLDTSVKDEAGGYHIKYGTKSMAQEWLNFGVNRKVTKRSVMTLAYGSKEYGFRQQLLDDIIEPNIKQFVINKYSLAAYMAKLIWESVTKTVVKAVEGMKWLQDVANIVCKGGKVVTWVTPMGLPVQQNYVETTTKVFKLRFMNTEKRFYVTDHTGNVAKRKQVQGIAPNFIHSMDASHLQWSINLAVDAGIHHYAMIHDSYATSPAQADTLFKAVRQAFVQMYTENDVLQNFAEDMQMLTDEKLPPRPEMGCLDINLVLNSLYMFH